MLSWRKKDLYCHTQNHSYLLWFMQIIHYSISPKSIKSLDRNLEPWLPWKSAWSPFFAESSIVVVRNLYTFNLMSLYCVYCIISRKMSSILIGFRVQLSYNIMYIKCTKVCVVIFLFISKFFNWKQRRLDMVIFEYDIY